METSVTAAKTQFSHKSVISVYVKELRKYSRDELHEKFLFENAEETDKCIAKLMEYNVVRAVKNNAGEDKDISDLTDSDCVIADTKFADGSFSFVFKFVGVIVFGSRVLKCYPKYLLSIKAEPEDGELSRDEDSLNNIRDDSSSEHDGLDLRNRISEIKKVDHHLKLAISAIRKYNSKKEQNMSRFVSLGENKSFDLLSVILFLLNDYYEFGVYANAEYVTDINGNDEILWDRTISETTALFNNGRPIYTELITLKHRIDEHNYYMRLHECVLTRISKELKKSDLLEIFDIPGVDLTEEELEYFGDNDTIVYNIEKELNVQFNTRKRMVLEAMRTYIRLGASTNSDDSFTLYGSTNFNLVWQDVCASVFDNRLYTPYKDIESEFGGKFDKKSGKGKNLIDFVEKPKWTYWNGYSAKTLEPDIVSIDKGDDGLRFVILDAKYYIPNTNGDDQKNSGVVPAGLPGIESITKQYLYQVAFWPIISKLKSLRSAESHEGCKVYNCFLMPTEEDEVQEFGSVSMKMFSLIDVAEGDCSGNTQNRIEDIKIRSLPASKCFENYLNNVEMNIEDLKL